MKRSPITSAVWLGLAKAALADPRPLDHEHLGEPLPSPRSHVVYHGLGFGNAPAETLDLYTADPVAPRSPVIVYLHAGELSEREAEDLTTQVGAVLVSLERREADHGAAARDAAGALVWVEANIADFGGDPERIVVTGHGAEATLASLVATDARYLGEAGRDASLLAGVVAIDGDGFFPPDDGPGREAPGADPGAAPATHVAEGKTIPPHLLLHVTAAADPDSRSEIQSNSMAAALRSAGVRADVAALDHVDRAGARERFGATGDPATAALERFLQRLSGADARMNVR